MQPPAQMPKKKRKLASSEDEEEEELDDIDQEEEEIDDMYVFGCSCAVFSSCTAFFQGAFESISPRILHFPKDEDLTHTLFCADISADFTFV